MYVLAHKAKIRATAVATAILLSIGGTPLQSLASAAQQAQAADPVAASVAARKKRFEEEKRRLEEGDSTSKSSSRPDQTFFVSPAKVTLLVGETQTFGSFDINGKTLTTQSDWTISSSSSVATISTASGPTVTAKSTGKFTVRARLGSRDAEAEVTILSGGSLAPGAVRWSAAVIPGFETKQIKPAVPTANGPDIYVIEVNKAGENLVRALTSDGVQLWMRRFSQHITQAVAH
jgi:plastocyanin